MGKTGRDTVVDVDEILHSGRSWWLNHLCIFDYM